MTYEMELIDREERGREEGRAEGRVAGIAEGRVAGIAEGQNEARKSIALDMIQMGKSFDEIQMITKLPVELIIELNKSKNRG